MTLYDPPSASRRLSSDGNDGWCKVRRTRLDVAGGLTRKGTKRARAKSNESNMYTQNMRRGAATAAPDLFTDGEAGAVPGLVRCPECGKGPLKGARGLSL